MTRIERSICSGTIADPAAVSDVHLRLPTAIVLKIGPGEAAEVDR
jgi:hypothetical protein